MLWRLFQTSIVLAVLFAGVYASETLGMPNNPLIIGGFGIGIAYLGTVTLSWLIDMYRRIFTRPRQAAVARGAVREPTGRLRGARVRAAEGSADAA